jgi:Zn-dependent peptidase ImmA (M78 family)
VVVRVEVRPELYAWAGARSRLDRDELTGRFPKLEEWEAGRTSPTLRQLEEFAKATRTPIGYLFLPEPPEEQVPIPDYRTMADESIQRPSPDLLDTIYQCEQRQEWFQSYALANELDPLQFVGSCTLDTPPLHAANQMREALNFGLEQREPTWTDTLRSLRENAEEAGLLVMVNGVVGSNTHRRLDPEEFRGFVLVDRLAPTIFVNGADTKAAQIFTLAHELAHIWLGESGLDNANPGTRAHGDVETWCNRVSAEFLVPMEELRNEYREYARLTDELDRLARTFKVSTLVILRRVHEAGYLEWPHFRAAYEEEVARVMEFATERNGGGGNFYYTQPLRVSRAFARAVISETLAGRTSYSEAFRMLSIRKTSTFNQMAEQLGVI